MAQGSSAELGRLETHGLADRVVGETASSHITRWPRMIVPTALPVSVHLPRTATSRSARQASPADRPALLEVDHGEIGVIAERDAALADEAEDALWPERWSDR
jgi:hypothetical protein